MSRGEFPSRTAFDPREVAQRLPDPLVKAIVETYVGLAKRNGSNVFEYAHGGDEFKFQYEDFDSFGYLYGCISNGRIRREGVPLELLDVPPVFDAICDVGAHFGVYSVALGVKNPDVPLYSFEPNPRNARILRGNLEANGIDAAVIERIVSDTSERTEFYEHPSDHNTHTATRPSNSEAFTIREHESVALSEFLAAESIDDPFLKIDAEGEEAKIVPDLLEDADYGKLSGILELHPERMPGSTDVEDVLGTLDSHGFDYSLVKDTEATPAYYFSNFRDA